MSVIPAIKSKIVPVIRYRVSCKCVIARIPQIDTIPVVRVHDIARECVAARRRHLDTVIIIIVCNIACDVVVLRTV